MPICHKKESSKARCVNGRYRCSSCHTQGMDTIFGLCHWQFPPAHPYPPRMMGLSFTICTGETPCISGSGIYAYKNAGGKLDLESALREMYSRGKAVPGGACGFWGACGAGISARQTAFIAGITPLAGVHKGLSSR